MQTGNDVVVDASRTDCTSGLRVTKTSDFSQETTFSFFSRSDANCSLCVFEDAVITFEVHSVLLSYFALYCRTLFKHAKALSSIVRCPIKS